MSNDKCKEEITTQSYYLTSHQPHDLFNNLSSLPDTPTTMATKSNVSNESFRKDKKRKRRDGLLDEGEKRKRSASHKTPTSDKTTNTIPQPTTPNSIFTSTSHTTTETPLGMKLHQITSKALRSLQPTHTDSHKTTKTLHSSNAKVQSDIAIYSTSHTSHSATPNNSNPISVNSTPNHLKSSNNVTLTKDDHPQPNLKTIISDTHMSGVTGQDIWESDSDDYEKKKKNFEKKIQRTPNSSKSSKKSHKKEVRNVIDIESDILYTDSSRDDNPKLNGSYLIDTKSQEKCSIIIILLFYFIILWIYYFIINFFNFLKFFFIFSFFSFLFMIYFSLKGAPSLPQSKENKHLSAEPRPPGNRLQTSITTKGKISFLKVVKRIESSEKKRKEKTKENVIKKRNDITKENDIKKRNEKTKSIQNVFFAARKIDDSLHSSGGHSIAMYFPKINCETSHQTTSSAALKKSGEQKSCVPLKSFPVLLEDKQNPRTSLCGGVEVIDVDERGDVPLNRCGGRGKKENHSFSFKIFL
jgi:hypothetical protein